MYLGPSLTSNQRSLLLSGIDHKGEPWSPVAGSAQHAAARALERKGYGLLVTSQNGPGNTDWYFIAGREERP